MKFSNTKVFNIEGAIRGMRNAKNSWHLSDSNGDIIGTEDLKLAQKLIAAGSEHRKFLRQIMVSVDITAPIYFWKEFDTYKVGTVANSTSTMHTIQKTPITMDLFETDDLSEYIMYDTDNGQAAFGIKKPAEFIIDFLESLRLMFLQTGDIKYGIGHDEVSDRAYDVYQVLRMYFGDTRTPFSYYDLPRADRIFNNDMLED